MTPALLGVTRVAHNPVAVRAGRVINTGLLRSGLEE